MKIDCPLCKRELKTCGEEWIVPARGTTFRYFHCSYCDLVFLDPELRPTREEEESRYLEHNNSPEDGRYVRYLRSFAEEALLPYVKPPQKVLDFGSGPSPVFARLLGDAGFSVDLYDPLFAPHSAWRDKQYEAITAIEVAEHLFEPLNTFREISRLIRPGGYLVLRTLLHYSDRGRFASWWYRQDPTHVTFYSPRSFAVLAELLRFELVTIKAGRSVIMRRLASLYAEADPPGQ